MYCCIYMYIHVCPLECSPKLNDLIYKSVLVIKFVTYFMSINAIYIKGTPCVFKCSF